MNSCRDSCESSCYQCSKITYNITYSTTRQYSCTATRLRAYMQIHTTHLQHLTWWLWRVLQWGSPLILQSQPALQTPQRRVAQTRKPVEAVRLPQPGPCKTRTESRQSTNLQLRGTNAPYCIAEQHGIDVISCCHDVALPCKETVALAS